ncbi:hypothetical protein TNCV_2563141 [Trichonephila clavipes]|uniref:Uncharacterized protein n=1 Tax=Trichonephila clavipes TaxID=2585209 RepID=A0A8X6R2N5_TRICX|nr:hypothetical protein TNCV_2563141 [Trichonephila clavipes]
MILFSMKQSPVEVNVCVTGYGYLRPATREGCRSREFRKSLDFCSCAEWFGFAFKNFLSGFITELETSFIASITKVFRLELFKRWRDIPRGTRPIVLKSVYATLDTEVHEQMFRSGDQSDAKTPSVKFPSKLDTHFNDPFLRDERLSQPCPARGVNLGPVV